MTAALVAIPVGSAPSAPSLGDTLSFEVADQSAGPAGWLYDAAGIRAGHDEMLEAALKHVLGRDIAVSRR
jgi:hypothetical protein